MSDQFAAAAEPRRWFYDNKILLCALCLASFVAIT
jgi:hypothetical protein